MNLRAWVEGLPDIAAVAVCEELVQFLSTRTTENLESLLAAVPVEIADQPAFAAALAQARVDDSLPVRPGSSAAVARGLLAAVADSPTLSPALAEVAEEYRDDKQSARAILSVGTAISMVIFVATTGVERTPDGEWRIIKDFATPALVEAVGGLIPHFSGHSAGKAPGVDDTKPGP